MGLGRDERVRDARATGDARVDARAREFQPLERRETDGDATDDRRPRAQSKHHPDLIMCRKMPGIDVGRLCEKCACEGARESARERETRDARRR